MPNILKTTSWGLIKRLAQNRLWDIALAIIVGSYLFEVGGSLPSRIYQWDFNHYYISARMLLKGVNPYTTPQTLFNPDARFAISPGLPFETNPPFLMWSLTPLGLFQSTTAFWILVSIQLCSFLAIFLLTYILLKKKLPLRTLYFLFGIILISNVTSVHFFYSQIQLSLAALLLWAFALQRKERNIMACLVATAVGALKIFPLALLPWFIWRDARTWKTMMVRLLSSLLLLISIMLFSGPRLWKDYFYYGLPVSMTTIGPGAYNYSIPSFLNTLLFVAKGGIPSVSTIQAKAPATNQIGLGLFFITLGFLWFRRKNRDLEFSLLTAMMLLSLPLNWGHYFVFLIFPCAVLFLHLRKSPSTIKIVLFIVSLLLMNRIDEYSNSLLGVSSIWVVFISMYLPFLGLCIMAGLILREISQTVQ